ncbi:MAG TPA: hypothetical protein VN954_05000 [Ktedonobacteraceae bacterium]|nr:hypothetical protein [Ktedonobacteraceae bacterium]
MARGAAFAWDYNVLRTGDEETSPPIKTIVRMILPEADGADFDG